METIFRNNGEEEIERRKKKDSGLPNGQLVAVIVKALRNYCIHVIAGKKEHNTSDQNEALEFLR